MKQVSTIGLDLAKQVFQVHGVDGAGTVVVRRTLRRRQVLAFFAKLPRCLVGLEACATAHYWARELIKLGHDVRLIPSAGSQGRPWWSPRSADPTPRPMCAGARTRRRPRPRSARR